MTQPKQRQQDPRTPLESDQAPLPGAARRATPPLEMAPPWLGPIIHRRHVDRLWLLVAGILMASALTFFGWRGVMSIVIVMMAATATFLLTSQVMQMLRPQRPPDSFLHMLAQAAFLGACMPVLRHPGLVVLAGFLLGIVIHLVGRTHRVRTHPVAVVMVVLWLFPIVVGQGSGRIDTVRFLDPIDSVLRPNALVIGDLHDTAEAVSRKAWTASMNDDEYDAVRRLDPYSLLVDDQQTMLQPPSILVNMLGSGELARMQELLLGVTPGPVGASSRALVILMGLYLMYRKVSRPWIAVWAFVAALAALVLMPFRDQEVWTLVGTRLLDLEPAVAVTYVGYMILASPLPMIALILAPTTAPMSAAGRVIYGIIIGSTLIIMQWWLKTPYAAYVGLFVASTLSRPLDALHYSPFANSREVVD